MEKRPTNVITEKQIMEIKLEKKAKKEDKKMSKVVSYEDIMKLKK